MSRDRIAVIGLGYVGLPVAITFSEKYFVIGFDINKARIDALNRAEDYTNEVPEDRLRSLLYRGDALQQDTGISFTDDPQRLTDCNIYIITVPTPVDKDHCPDLSLLTAATATVGAVLKKGDIVIYESTVYPGCTEEVAVPILEQRSKLTYNQDFYCGYSPERINPGDKERTIDKIIKITSGSNLATAQKVDLLYRSVVTAGTYLAPSIKVAEAAKVIENTQRDVNIAFMNELSKLFYLLGIDTHEVLKAASTKWNFLNFKPGLVGGHCIGVDPYYLIDKSVSVGYEPEIIRSARKVNNSMGKYVSDRVVSLMKEKKIALQDTEVLVMGVTFKEDFPDVRNSKVVELTKELASHGIRPVLVDPLASPAAVTSAYDLISLTSIPRDKKYAAIVLAVNHTIFSDIDYASILQSPGVLFDVKGFLQNTKADGRL